MLWRRTLRRLAAAGAVALVAATLHSGAAVAAYDPPDHLDQWWYDAMSLAEVQRATNGGEGVKVAVFDGYLDPTVPDLQGADITIQPGCKEEPTPRVTGPRADHGTAMVTAIVGQGRGNGPGGTGVLGVAPRASVDFYSLNAFHTDGEDPDCTQAGEMLVRAVENGADVISMSATGGLFGLMEPYVKKATDMGAVFVVSAGTIKSISNQVEAPAWFPGVVAIGAADSDAKPWGDNPYVGGGSLGNIDLLAPGVDTEIGGFVDGRWVSGGSRTGTSGAAAIAAGAFALAAAAHPEATGNQLVQTALHTAQGGGPLKYRGPLGWGTVRAAKMVEQDPLGWPDENPFFLEPQQVVDTYPSDSYGDQTDDETTEPSADEAAAGGEQAGDEQAGDEQAGDARSGTQEANNATTEDGLPLGALAIGGLLGLAVLGGAVVLARRRGTKTT